MTQATKPAEWTDDETMGVLFGPFRESRSVNPSSWDRKLNFWSRLVNQRYILEGKPYFNARDLPRQFERKGKVPFCLGVVVNDMLKRGQLQKLSDFYASSPKSWGSWTYQTFIKKPVQLSFSWFVKKPLAWTYRKLVSGDERSPSVTAGLTGADSMQGLENTELVVLDALKQLSEQVLGTHYNGVKNPATDTVEGMEEFRQKCQKCCKDQKSFELALLWLCYEKKCIVQDTGQEKVILFAAAGQAVKQELSETDLRIYRLKNAENKLYEQVLTLGEEIEKLRQEAKLYLQKGMKSSAKNCLRKKKRLEAQQAKKETAIDNIEHLLVTIHQAYSDKQVIDAYSSGVEAFKDISKKYGLTPDMVDDVMVGVQEVLETQDELNRSISSPILPDEPYLGDLEEELQGILDAEEPLPKVPVGEPLSPHQELIDSMCQMKFAEEELPDVPTHIPEGSPVGFPQISPMRHEPTSPSRVAMLDLGRGGPSQMSEQQQTWKSPAVRQTGGSPAMQHSHGQRWDSPPGNLNRNSLSMRVSPSQKVYSDPRNAYDEGDSQTKNQGFFQPWASSPDRNNRNEPVGFPSIPIDDPASSASLSREWYRSSDSSWVNPDIQLGDGRQNKDPARRGTRPDWLSS